MSRTHTKKQLSRFSLLVVAACGIALVPATAESGRNANGVKASRAALTPPVGGSLGLARGTIVVRRTGNASARDTVRLDLAGLRRNSRYTIAIDDPTTPGSDPDTVAVVRTGRSRHARARFGRNARFDLPGGASLDDLAGLRIEVRDAAGGLVLSGDMPSLDTGVLAVTEGCRLVETIDFEDTFDEATADAAPPGWDVTGTDVAGVEVLVDATVFDGDAGLSVRLTDTVAADPGAPAMARPFTAQTGFFAVEFTLISDANPARLVCRVSDSTVSPPAVPTGFGEGLGLYEDGTIGFALGDSIGTVTASTAHHFRVDFDIAAQTFDVTLDGVLVADDRVLGLTGTSLDRIEFAGTNDTTGTAFVDTVRVIHQEQDCPPTANAGTDQVIECNGATIAVTLDGSASADPEGAELTYTWSGDFVEGTATGVNPTVNFAGTGSHTVTLVVNDGFFDSAPDDVLIEIQDTTPPELSVTGLPGELWPPNHKLIAVAPSVVVTDGCDASGVEVTLVITSNEPDNGTGDGNTSGDWVVRSASDFDLRAERAGPGSGRVYTLVWTAVDAAGNSSTHEAHVVVPHDRGGGNGGGSVGNGNSGGNSGGNGNGNGVGNGNGRGNAYGHWKSRGRGRGRGRGNGR